ncbi:MAG TPA: PIN domain-containing protein [Mycobacteriales bacterium]|nr:PIN domain-containing protein [Mycobacteriales bacterium]
MGTVVLDSSVVLALLDPDDVLHASSAGAVRQWRDSSDGFLLPAVVLAEVLVGAARGGAAELATRRDLIVDAFGAPYPVDEEVAVAAARRRAGHRSLRLPDALVIATADVAGATAILTGDKRWHRIDARIQIIT